MKKTKILIALLFSCTLISAGCSDTTQDEVTEETNVEEVVEEENDQDEVAVDEEMNEETDNTTLFEQTKNLDAYYYEITTDIADGTSYDTNVWSSGNKTKMESHYPDTGETVSMIMDGEEDAIYLYMPAENLAMKVNFDNSAFIEDDNLEGAQDYVEIMKELADDEEVTIEKGTLDGESVKIVTGEIEGNTNIIWVSEKTGFPLKSEFYMDGKLESTALFKSFEEKSIDPSIFNLPEDVEIQDMTNF